MAVTKFGNPMSGEIVSMKQSINTNTQNIANINSALRPTSVGWVTNADLNNYTTTGQYMIGNNPTNAPVGWGMLSVVANRSDTLYQTYVVNGTCYYREYRVASGWNSWQQVATKSDVDQKLSYYNIQPNSSVTIDVTNPCIVIFIESDTRGILAAASNSSVTILSGALNVDTIEKTDIGHLKVTNNNSWVARLWILGVIQY